MKITADASMGKERLNIDLNNLPVDYVGSMGNTMTIQGFDRYRLAITFSCPPINGRQFETRIIVSNSIHPVYRLFRMWVSGEIAPALLEEDNAKAK